jgi:hypothetical protein
LISNYKKEKLKESFKIISIIFGIGLVILFAILYYYNYSYTKKVEKKILSYNNYEIKMAPFNGLKLNFKDVSCKGFFNYECTLSDLVVYSEDNKEREEYLLAKKFLIKDINERTNERNLNIEVKSIMPSKFLESKMFFSDFLVPFDISFSSFSEGYINYKDKKLNKVPGKISFSLSNKSLDFSFKAFYEVIETREPYSIKIDENHTIIKDSNIKNKMIGERRYPQFHYTKIKNATFYLKNKNLIKALYSFYTFQGKSPDVIKYINTVYLNSQKESLLTKEEFKKSLKEVYTLYGENNYKIAKTSSEYMLSLLNDKKQSLKVSFINKTGISLEEYTFLISEVGLAPEEVLENNFIINQEIK